MAERYLQIAEKYNLLITAARMPRLAKTKPLIGTVKLLTNTLKS